jgi:hypothetical protein
MSNNMKISEIFQSKYLKAGDLPEEGSQVVTIEKIGLEEIGKDKETKIVLYFEELQQALICNKTNARTIARLMGSEDLDDWVGKTIRLYRTEVDFQGDMVEAVRVRSKPEKVVTKPVTKRKAAPVDDEVEIDEVTGIPF